MSRLIRSNINIIILIIFAVLSFGLLRFHEPWRDEAQAWLIVEQSNSLIELFRNLRYEGSPAIWHIVLYVLQSLGFGYSSQFILHIIISLAGLAIFLYKSPFTILQKVFFAFGYYKFYEYNIIARSYSLDILFLFLAAAFYDKRISNPLPYIFSLILLMQTNTHGFILAGVLSAFYAYDLLKGNESLFQKLKKSASKLILLMAGGLATIAQLVPAPDLGIYDVWETDINTLHLMIFPRALITALFAQPLEIDIYSTPITESRFLIIIFFLIGLGAMVYFILPLLKKPRGLLLFAAGVSSLLLVFFLKDQGEHRHYGLIFSFLLFTLWISHDDKELQLRNVRFDKFLSLLTSVPILYLILFVQFGMAVIVVTTEMRFQFSQAEHLSEYLEENSYREDTIITSYPSAIVTSVTPLLSEEKPSFYFLEYQQSLPYMIWNKQYEHNLTLDEQDVIERVSIVGKHSNRDHVLFITNEQLDNEVFKEHYALLRIFKPAIKKDEIYYVYEVR